MAKARVVRIVGQGQCPSCEVLRIQGMRCHETSCPNAWREERRECLWCGSEFVPEERWQAYCDYDCFAADNG